MRRDAKPPLTARVVFGVLILVGTACESPVPPAAPFELREGVIVDPLGNAIYVMNPEGGIDAVELSDGSVLWSTKDAAKPLALVGNRLVALAEPEGASNELELVILNTQTQETSLIAPPDRLPSEVRVTIDDTLNSRFHTRAVVENEIVFVAWQYSHKKVRGAAPPAGASNRPRILRGGFRFDLSSNNVVSIEETELPATLADPPRVNLVGADRLQNLPTPQFVSAVGDHVFTSKRIADDRVWDKYQWTIYEHTTGDEIAKIRSHRSHAPFFVSDSKIVYETSAFSRRTDEGMIDEPLKIRAVDLKSNTQLWSRSVRDTTYRGPYPP